MTSQTPCFFRARATSRRAAAAILVVLAGGAAFAVDTTASAQLARFSAEAGQAPSAERGQAFFTQHHGGQWSCSSCHGNPPSAQGKHAATGKTIAPLAPAFNPQAFTDTAKVDKWLRRNCKDVVSRECTALEKADVLAYLTRLK